MQTLEDIINLIRPLAKPAVRLSVPMEPGAHTSSECPLSRMASKFGGLPYIKVGEEWPVCPTCCNRLPFIFQCNLAEAAMPWPSQAWFFTFFYCYQCYPGGDEGEPEGQWAVRLYSSDEFKPSLLAPTEPYEGKYPTREYKIRFEPAMSYPCPDELYAVAPEIDQMRDGFDDDYERAVVALGGMKVDDTRLGGYPGWVQGRVKFAPLEVFAVLQSGAAWDANTLWGGGPLNLFIDQAGKSVSRMILQLD